ncbi:MAG TPA: ROK family protein [Phycisphaerae bacterium]|nr:ROK family protein [Phycisphaerae bacterium]
MSEPATRLAIGVDVGGTAVKAGLVDELGRVLQTDCVPTEADRGVDHVLARLADVVGKLQVAAQSMTRPVLGVGLGVPGTLSRARGIVISPPNLPGWKNVPIVKRLKAATGLTIWLDNDANNAALGEALCGAGRGVQDMVMLTLGTGVGGGIIAGGRLWRGAQENAGELGHMIVQAGGRRCGCGQLGCLEALASATATVTTVSEFLAQGRDSTLQQILKSGRDLQCEDVQKAADAGDAVGREAWLQTCRYLAIACINIHHILNPQRIVLSGGMSSAGQSLLQPVTQFIAEFESKMLGDPPEIRLAELGNDAGFIGSALSVFQP